MEQTFKIQTINDDGIGFKDVERNADAVMAVLHQGKHVTARIENDQIGKKDLVVCKLEDDGMFHLTVHTGKTLRARRWDVVASTFHIRKAAVLFLDYMQQMEDRFCK